MKVKIGNIFGVLLSVIVLVSMLSITATAVSAHTNSRLYAVTNELDSGDNEVSPGGSTLMTYAITKSLASAASVSLSASGPSGTLGSAGGEIASETYPASYTVFAEASGCNVTKIVYTLNDRTYTTYDSFVTITADTQSDFQTSTFTAYTDVSGVSATFTVNFKYVKKSVAYVMWETSSEAVIRSITGNGLQKTLAYAMTIPNSYDSQGNLTEEQVATIQGLIGRNDGLTYMVNYTRSIRVYTPAEYSDTGEKQYLATYDGNSSNEIADCLSRWGWTANTQAAIQQAASSSLSFTTGQVTDCTAIWMDTSTNEQIYSKKFGSATVTPSQAVVVSVSFSDCLMVGNHVYEYLTYDGDTSGRSTLQAYSQTYTVNSKPLTVTFYCHPEKLDSTPSDANGSITVIVRDAETKAAIPDASVHGSGTVAQTDQTGSVTFSGLSYGDYSFSAQGSGYGYGSGKGSITAESPEITVIIYMIRAWEQITGDIAIYVRDANTDTYIPNAVISGNLQGTANAFGCKSFSGLSLGTYSFTASKPGYYSNSSVATVTSDSPMITVTVYLTPIPSSGTVTVYVKDVSTDALIPGATVSTGDIVSSTDSNGCVSFKDLMFGEHIFSASKSGYSMNSDLATISASAPSQSITIYLSPNTVDVGIAAETVVGTVYRGSTIMVSADVYGDAEIDFTPDNPLTVTMEATRNGGVVFDAQTKSVICPQGETNLVWFALDIPETGYTSADVTITFLVATPENIADSTDINDVSTRTVITYVLPARKTPNARFELEPSSDYSKSIYKSNNSKELSWSVWEWSGGFVEKTYSAKLTVKVELRPDITAIWSKYSHTKKLWTTRSGYGLNTAVTVSLTGVDEAMFAGNAKVNTYYPEFNYSTATNKSNMLVMENENESGYSAFFTFDCNTDTISNNKMHITPVWFPDGEYSVKYVVYDIWTPAGMLTSNTYAIINIEGSMYDDYYTQRN